VGGKEIVIFSGIFSKTVSRGLGVKIEKKGSFLKSLYTTKQSLEGEGGTSSCEGWLILSMSAKELLMSSQIFCKAGGERSEGIVESSGSTWIRTVQ